MTLGRFLFIAVSIVAGGLAVELGVPGTAFIFGGSGLLLGIDAIITAIKERK